MSKEIADKLRQHISSLVNNSPNKSSDVIIPQVVILQVGHVSSSDVYIRRKLKFAEEIGVKGTLLNFSEDVKTAELVSEIEKINADPSVHGIILQLPIPRHLDQSIILNTISPEKDVDGLSDTNIWLAKEGDHSAIIPATARGIVELLKGYNIEISSKKVAIVGSSLLGGQTISSAFRNEGAIVEIYDETTQDIAVKSHQADILVSAVGKAGLINASYVHENQIVIDVGIFIDSDGKIRGDVHSDIQSGKIQVAAVTPVPGGVGPMSVASLFKNLIDTYTKHAKGL